MIRMLHIQYDVLKIEFRFSNIKTFKALFNKYMPDEVEQLTVFLGDK